jgi:hypothetical protein
MCDSQRGFGLDIGFTDHLWILPTSNYNSLMRLQTPNIFGTTAHMRFGLIIGFIGHFNTWLMITHVYNSFILTHTLYSSL